MLLEILFTRTWIGHQEIMTTSLAGGHDLSSVKRWDHIQEGFMPPIAGVEVSQTVFGKHSYKGGEEEKHKCTFSANKRSP